MEVVFKEDIKGYSFGVLKTFSNGDIVDKGELDDFLFDAWKERGVIDTVVENVELDKPKKEKVEVKVEKVEKKPKKQKPKPVNKKVKKETVEEK